MKANITDRALPSFKRTVMATLGATFFVVSIYILQMAKIYPMFIESVSSAGYRGEIEGTLSFCAMMFIGLFVLIAVPTIPLMLLLRAFRIQSLWVLAATGFVFFYIAFWKSEYSPFASLVNIKEMAVNGQQVVHHGQELPLGRLWLFLYSAREASMGVYFGAFTWLLLRWPKPKK